AEMTEKYPDILRVILSSVKDIAPELPEFLKLRFPLYIELSRTTSLPFINKYKTPQTMGKDRIAAVAGAQALFPSSCVLVIDAGTAVTYDFINSAGEYMGGNISPGLSIRFRALNAFTGKLPLVEKREKHPFLATDTEEAIVSGVQNGLLFEMDAYIDEIRNRYRDAKIILTGGDCNFFDKKLKNTIFAEPDLVLTGLNKILEFNAQYF
ncbi:MAG: type III pantothenate kinase, partial [Bacteroidetes bacterium]|nr:type III pantothenate kinase [Bacteroidota bacterium]